MNVKYLESLTQVLQLDSAFPKKLPCPADAGRSFQLKPNGEKQLTPEDHHLYRKGVGILLYMAPERPDLKYTLKKLSTKLAQPTEADMELLRYVGKCVTGCPDIVLCQDEKFPGQSFQDKRNLGKKWPKKRSVFEQQSLLEVCSDSDWAAERSTRQSASCGVIFLNRNLVHFQSKRQRSIALSSCEAETIASTSILSEAVFLRDLITRITGQEPEMVLYSDSSSSRQLISRKGLGKARHLDVNLLWIQKLIKAKDKRLLVRAIPGPENPADLGTEALTCDKIRKYVKMLEYRGDYIDEEVVQKKIKKEST